MEGSGGTERLRSLWSNKSSSAKNVLSSKDPEVLYFNYTGQKNAQFSVMPFHGHPAPATIISMELAIQIQVEELPEGLFLATSDELPGLLAQGRTVAEALDIARDVARKLIEARREREGVPNLPTTSERRDYTIVVAA